MPLAGVQVPGVHLAFYAYKYGQIPVDQLETALAVAYGESHWFDKSYNFNDATGDRSFGVWQVNLLGTLHAARMRDFGLTREEELYDLPTNARCMGLIYRESQSWGYNGWRPWGAFTNGSYERHTALGYLAVKTFKDRLAESGDRLHIGGEADCDSL